MWRTVVFLYCVTAVTVTASVASEQSGLLGHWKFDDAIGDVAVDSSGHGNDGEVWDAKWVRGPFGTALAFDGNGAHVRVPEIAGLDGSDEMTLEAWVLWEGTGRYPNIISGGTWSPGGFMVFVQENHCSFRMGRPGVSATGKRKEWREVGVPLVTPFELGRWYHLAATFNRPTIKTYVNGQQVASSRWDYPVGYRGDLVIGKWSGSASHKGLIDDVRLYKRALTGEEIASNYQQKEMTISSDKRNEPLYQKIPRKAQLASAVAVFETKAAKLAIGPSGRCIALMDKESGQDRLVHTTPLVTIRCDDVNERRADCSLEDGKLVFRFRRSKAKVVLTVRPMATGNRQVTSGGSASVDSSSQPADYFLFRVDSVEGVAPESVSFVRLNLKQCEHVHNMSGLVADEDFGVCLRTLNLQTHVSVSGNPLMMTATAFEEHGIEGAAAGLVACPRSRLRPALQEMLRREGVPHSELGGPFALDAQANRGSYVFASVSEKNVDQWIELAKRGGIDCIHMSGWASSLGHYEPRASTFPNGLDGLKQVVHKIHDAGLRAGMHTLTGCISPHDPWVRPVPDPRLATDGTFTLADDLDKTAVAVPTEQAPGDYPTVWAYSSRGNCIRIDDELILYSKISNQAGCGFFECQRGAFGTTPAVHKKGTPVHHMLVRYGCFLPDEKSTLVDDVADRIAHVFNTCEMDQIYMDGAEAMRGWYGVARMRQEIYSRLERPVLVEASCWNHHSWPFHSRVGAWDHPKWGLKRFADDHLEAVSTYRRACLLEAQLGWWVILGPSRDWDMEMPDEIEYLCAKALGHDAPLSFQGVSVSGTPPNARQDEYFSMIGNYERLRLANYFSESVKRRLREQRQEFRLERSDEGAWQLVPTDYLAHKVTGLENDTHAWTVTNRYGPQPLKLRIQALHSAYPYDDEKSMKLADFSAPDAFEPAGAASQVEFATKLAELKPPQGESCRSFRATNKRDSPVGAWARAVKTWDPVVDLTPYDALGVWVHGDGKGELLNIQLTNQPEYFRTLDDHYVTVDFEGWRYFELLFRERDAAAYHDYQWPYGAHCVLHRSPLVRKAVNRMSVYLNDLPPHEEVQCTLGPIKALRTRKVVLHNPAVEVAGRRLVFPVELESGMYIEFESMEDCRLYDERGRLLKRFRPQGNVPSLDAQENQLSFSCQGPQGFRSRARVTVITLDTPLRDKKPDDQIDWSLLSREYEPPRQIRALDGHQNRWEVVCPPQVQSAEVDLEIDVAQVGGQLTAYQAESAVTCASFEKATREQDPAYPCNEDLSPDGCHEGVTHKLARSTRVAKIGDGSMCYTARSSRSDNRGWSYKPGELSEPLDLSNFSAIGFWLHGDGNGQSFKLQLRDGDGGWQDIYRKVDFSGWRYCQFELGGSQLKNRKKITGLNFYYNGIPGGQEVTCYIDEIRLLQEVEPLTDPELVIAGKHIRFPVAVHAGDRLVYHGMDDCYLYRDTGEMVAVTAEGVRPRLTPGRNEVVFGVSKSSPDDFRVSVSLKTRYTRSPANSQ